MIARALILVAAGLGLAACQPAIPDSGQGVGFGDQFSAEQRARDAALTGQPIPAAPAVSAAPLGATPTPGSAEATAAETAAILAATRPGGATAPAPLSSGAEPVQASPLNPPPPVIDSAGISDENNFDAVSGQRSIEGDAARIAANRAQYQVIQPEALPDRADAGPNIVAYALQTNHARGTKVYRRSFTRQSTTDRNCAAYASPDQAQIDFLALGGPERDRQGLDPDGDGFACAWDPSPFRRAAQQG